MSTEQLDPIEPGDEIAYTDARCLAIRAPIQASMPESYTLPGYQAYADGWESVRPVENEKLDVYLPEYGDYELTVTIIRVHNDFKHGLTSLHILSEPPQSERHRKIIEDGIRALVNRTYPSFIGLNTPIYAIWGKLA